MIFLKRIQRRAGVRSSLSNIGWLGSDRMVRMLGAVLVSTLVARYLGPNQFGLLNYGLAIYGLFNTLSNLGLDSLVIREVALDAREEPHVLGTAFVLKAVGSVATTAGAILAARLLEPHDTILLIIVALMSIASISQALDVIDYFFQARVQSRYVAIPRMIVFVIASIARAAAVLLKMKLLAFAWIAALEVLATEIGLGITYLYVRRPQLRWQWHVGRAKELFAESWPLMISSLMIMIYLRTDQVLLGKMAPMSVVGNYAAAIRLSETWYSVPLIIAASVMPRLLQSREQNPARYYARLQLFYEVMVFLSVVITVLVLFAGPSLIRLLYGKEFTSAASILSVHIWTGIFVFLGAVSAQQYVHERITVSVMRRTALGAIVNVGLNLWWIPLWGGIGSAMATLVAQSISSYFADALDRRTRHIFRMKTRAYWRFWMVPGLVWRELRP